MFDLLNQLLPSEVSVLIMSMLPIIELRGAIPLGIGLGMTPIKATIISIFGNSLIVPILLVIINPLFTYFKKLDKLRGFVTKYEERATKKMENYRKYRMVGLFLLVAIPLPMTGVYTGCVAAIITKVTFKHSCMAIIAGVISAGIIVYLLSNGVYTIVNV